MDIAVNLLNLEAGKKFSKQNGLPWVSHPWTLPLKLAVFTYFMWKKQTEKSL